jgi:hypothetical protein
VTYFFATKPSTQLSNQVTSLAERHHHKMLAVIAILQLLDVLIALLSVFWSTFWLVVAVADLSTQKVLSLYVYIFSLFKHYQHNYRRTRIQRSHKNLINPTTPPTHPPQIIYDPQFDLHSLIYNRFRLQSRPKRQALIRSGFLSGSRFASLADSVIDNEPLPIVGRLGLRLPDREIIEHLKTLPVLMVTPPEDGDRKPEAGERGGKGLKYEAGLLAPPKRRGKAGKRLKEAKRVRGG